jgi:hypothetical protein
METFLDKQQEKFLEALKENMGVVSITLEQVKVSRPVYDDWMTEIFFKEKVKEIAEQCLDYVEKKLMDEIKAGNLNAIQFYLKTKGANRGYV